MTPPNALSQMSYSNLDAGDLSLHHTEIRTTITTIGSAIQDLNFFAVPTNTARICNADYQSRLSHVSRQANTNTRFLQRDCALRPGVSCFLSLLGEEHCRIPKKIKVYVELKSKRVIDMEKPTPTQMENWIEIHRVEVYHHSIFTHNLQKVPHRLSRL